MPPVVFETTISAGEWRQTYALGHTASAPPSSTKVEERVELYLYSPFGTLACPRGNYTFYKNKYTKVTHTHTYINQQINSTFVHDLNQQRVCTGIHAYTNNVKFDFKTSHLLSCARFIEGNRPRVPPSNRSPLPIRILVRSI